ncbi:MAG: response regulator [Candidatus Nomurabacteria bacterium]|nr:response regulator [Candidatus Nomurabacteria bacterium]
MEDKKTILIVEDEKSISGALSDKLNNEGYTILQAKNGEEGLKIALKEHPDLMLVDILMPKMDGIKMAKELRKDIWGKTAKIIILTNVTDLNQVQEVMDSEVFEYLTKSNVTLEYLTNKVKDFLNR